MLGFGICALTTIPERADVGDGSGGERGTSEPNPKERAPKPLRRREGHWLAFNGLEGYYREHMKGKSEGTSETPDFSVTVSREIQTRAYTCPSDYLCGDKISK